MSLVQNIPTNTETLVNQKQSFGGCDGSERCAFGSFVQYRL